MFLIFNFWSWIFDKSSKFWAASCKKESILLLVWFTVCIEPCFPIGWRTEKISQSAALFWFGLRNDESKEQLMSLPHLWNTVDEKDRGLSTCNPWTEQAGGLEAFLHGAAQNFEVVLNIQDQK
jgi:hypothetical protein